MESNSFPARKQICTNMENLRFSQDRNCYYETILCRKHKNYDVLLGHDYVRTLAKKQLKHLVFETCISFV